MQLEEIHLPNPLIINDLVFSVSKNRSLSSPEPGSLDESLKEDLWGFGYFWPSVVKTFSTIGNLYGAVQDLYEKIEAIKESYRPLAEIFPELKIEPNLDRGVSGSYFLIDEEGKRRYLIKPLDEDAGCIHSDGYTTPFVSSPLRSHISLYGSSMREVLAYEVACLIGLRGVVPKTSFGIFESDQFHHFSDQIVGEERRRYFEFCSEPNREKLCSVQEYVEGAKTLLEAIHELEALSLTDEEIESRFDQQDFEDANLLLWTTYDTDGHMGNFLVYQKEVDEIGNEILGLKKIDNGLAFPDKNQQMRNNLSYLPNAKQPLSTEGIRKIEAIDVEALANRLEAMGLDEAVPPLRERISYLKTLAKEPGITLKEINRKLIQLGKKE